MNLFQTWWNSKAAVAAPPIHHTTHTEAGRDQENQGVVAVLPHPADAAALIFVLADGQGGHMGASAAARTAAETILARAVQWHVGDLLQAIKWMELASRADEAVSLNPDAGYTTLVCGFIAQEQVYGVSSGDSAAYLFGAKNQTLTRDQSKNPPVGSGGASFTPFQDYMNPGDRVLIASDGVWKYSDDDELAALTGGGCSLTELRQHTLNRNGGYLPDDWSAILFCAGP